MKASTRRLTILALTITIMHCVRGAADDIDVRDLNDDEKAALATITEGQVLGTVSFLASDELAGRNTPSPELRIASAYVAARFRGAGLEPLGDDGTFFQTHNFPMTLPPEASADIQTANGTRLETLGVLVGGPENIEINDTKPVAESDADESSAVVIVDEIQLPPSAATRPSQVLAACSRRVRTLARDGAKVVLMKCGKQSALIEAARTMAQKPVRFHEDLQPACGIILIDEDSDITNTSLTVKLGAQRVVDNPVRNVIGVLRGADEDHASEAILISAHLDHIGRATRGDDSVNNGADDNASGVTAVLSLADAFGSLEHTPERSVIFATFWGEEKGLLGSKEFAKQPTWPLKDIVANINIEMIGRPETDAREKMWMTGWKHSDLGPLMNAGAQRIGVEVFNRTDIGEMLYTRSDNFAFVKSGVIAHSFSGGSLHGDYHQPTDEWTKLDIPHMTKVVQGLFAGSLFLTQADVTITNRDAD